MTRGAREAAIGWVELSRETLAAVSRELVAGDHGVRDELGFGMIHHAYAERFFPGTSVLMSRLRYAVFIPAIYRELISQHSSKKKFPFEALEHAEQTLARRLMKSYEGDLVGRGIIGYTVVRDQGRAPVQLPSQIYWPGLGYWGVIQQQWMSGNTAPDRSLVHRSWRYFSSTARPSREQASEFDDPPAPLFDARIKDPEEWQRKNKALSFKLSEDEQNYFTQKLTSLRYCNPAGEERQCLLGRLAEAGVDVLDADMPWFKAVLNAADSDDRLALQRAKHAAGAVCVARSIYQALVESLRDDGYKWQSDKFLQSAMADFGENAIDLDLDALDVDCGDNLGSLRPVLEATADFCTKPGKPTLMLDVFRNREIEKKGRRRARLIDNDFGAEARNEWESSQPRQLTYRWSVARRFLLDLAGNDAPL